MAQLQFNFTIAAPNSRGKVSLCVYNPNTSKRNYMVVNGLINPNCEYWDKKHQCFSGTVPETSHNNDILGKLRAQCDTLIAGGVSDNQELLTLIRKGATEKPIKTLGQFLCELIDEMRCRPTKNYQLAISLLHNLKGENHKVWRDAVKEFPKPMCNGVALIDTPISEIENAHLAAFAKWVKDIKGGSNFKNLNVQLQSVVNKAIERGENKNPITYRFRKDAPAKVTVKSSNELALTLEQFKQIEQMQGKAINRRGYRNKGIQALYLDVALLMYHTMSRPADVISFRYDMIRTTDKGNTVIEYIPIKKRTYNNAIEQKVTIPLTPASLAIINKYRGVSKGGYLLPLPMNETEHDITTVDGFSRWDYYKNKTCGCINAHLKKIGENIGLSFPLSLYTFRRSAITHAVNNGDLNIAKIAGRAGTSLDMIGKHYYQDNEL